MGATGDVFDHAHAATGLNSGAGVLEDVAHTHRYGADRATRGQVGTRYAAGVGKVFVIDAVGNLVAQLAYTCQSLIKPACQVNAFTREQQLAYGCSGGALGVGVGAHQVQ